MSTKFRRVNVPLKRILSVKVNWDVDGDPDLLHLGEYSNIPGDADRTIDRGFVGRDEYRYFIAAMSGEDTGDPESVRRDYERMEGYNNQQWYMLGVTAEASVVVAGRTIQTIRSGGLRGIESDSGDDCLIEAESEQLDELRQQLEAIGFSGIEINSAFKRVVGRVTGRAT